jgi:hypothetical protein
VSTWTSIGTSIGITKVVTCSYIKAKIEEEKQVGFILEYTNKI